MKETKERLSRAIFAGTVILSGWLGGGCAEKKEIECPLPASTLRVEGPKQEEFISLLSPESWISSDKSDREEVYAEWGGFFEVEELEKPPEVILGEAIDYIKEQLKENCGSSAENWFPRIKELKSRTYFLEPYLLLVETYFPYGGEEKEKLIERYQEDRKEAIIDLCFRVVFRRWGWHDLDRQGGYDLRTDKILINLHWLSDEWGKGLLVEEFWHGLPGVRIYQDESGDWYRESGFLQQKWSDECEAWSAEYWLPEELLPDDITQLDPTEIAQIVIFSTYRINEAFVDLMLPSYREPREPFEREQKLLERAFELFGKNKVISLYLQSNPKEFYRLILENCDQFPEFLGEKTICPTQ